MKREKAKAGERIELVRKTHVFDEVGDTLVVDVETDQAAGVRECQLLRSPGTGADTIWWYPLGDYRVVRSEGAGLPDSGERTEYETGAVRDCKEGKGRCDLMPLDVVDRLLDSECLALIAASKEDGSDCLYEAVKAFAEEWMPEQDGKQLPAAMLEVSKHFEAGAKKYGEGNWRKGIPVHSYVDSAVRHYLKYRAGWTDEPHERAVIWNLLCGIWTLEHRKELDDWTEEK